MTTHKVRIQFYVITQKTIEADVPDTLDGDEQPIVNCDYMAWQHIARRMYGNAPWIDAIRNAMEQEADTINGYVDWDDHNGITVTTNTTVLP